MVKTNILKLCNKKPGPMSDFDNGLDLNKNRKRENEYLINDLIIALAVCHNVTPSYENGIK
jgi:hypothetical protein